MAAAVMGDAAIAAGRQIEHLIFKGISGERPAVAENHRLSAAPVLVIDLRAILGRDRAHVVLSFAVVGRGRSVCVLPRCSHRHRRQTCAHRNSSGADQEPAAGCGNKLGSRRLARAVSACD